MNPRNFQRVLCALIGSACIGVAFGQAKDPDIVGLRLGMTVEQARERLKAYNPSFEYSEKTWRAQPGILSSLALIEATRPNGKPNKDRSARPLVPLEEIRVFFTQIGGRAYQVSRVVRLTDKRDWLTSVNLKRSLEEKYGTHELPTPYADHIWTWDAKNLPIKEKFNNPCFAIAMSPFTAMTRAVPICGIVIRASGVHPQENPDVVQEYRVSMFDNRILYSEIAEVERRVTEFEAKARETEAGAVKTNKPKL